MPRTQRICTLKRKSRGRSVAGRIILRVAARRASFPGVLFWHATGSFCVVIAGILLVGVVAIEPCPKGMSTQAFGALGQRRLFAAGRAFRSVRECIEASVAFIALPEWPLKGMGLTGGARGRWQRASRRYATQRPAESKEASGRSGAGRTRGRCRTHATRRAGRNGGRRAANLDLPASRLA